MTQGPKWALPPLALFSSSPGEVRTEWRRGWVQVWVWLELGVPAGQDGGAVLFPSCSCAQGRWDQKSLPSTTENNGEDPLFSNSLRLCRPGHHLRREGDSGFFKCWCKYIYSANVLWVLTHVHWSLRTAAVTKADVITERAGCSEEKLQDGAQSHGLADQQGLRPSQENWCSVLEPVGMWTCLFKCKFYEL